MELRACSLIYFPNIIDSMYDTIILLKYRINYEQAVELLYALSETLEYLNLIYDNFSANLKIFFLNWSYVFYWKERSSQNRI